MLRTVEEILEAVKKKDTDNSFVELTRRFEEDYSLWRLEPYSLDNKKASEYENYTTNEPRVLADKTVEVLASAPIQARIPLQRDDEEERDKKSNAERFFYGIMNLANLRLQATLQPSIKSQLATFAVLRGWFAIRAYFRKTEKRKTIPDIAIWDILHTRWDIGAEGLLWVCHKRPITKAQAKSEYDKDIVTETTIVYDFWDDEINAIILDGEFIREPKPHELDHIPILIKMVGSVPIIQSTRHTDTMKDSGESVFSADRNIYEHKNKLTTLYSTIVGQAAHNPLALYSAGGKKTFQKSPYYKGAVIQFDVDKGEKAEALYKPEMPKEVAGLLAIVQRDLSTGGMPPIAGGELNFQLPYSGIRELIEAARSIIKPRQQAIEDALEWLFREMVDQYGSGGFGKLRIYGRDGNDAYFDMNLSSKDIRGDWFPEVKLLPKLPEDEAGKFAMAELAIRNRIWSTETAMDKMGVQDTDAEKEKIARETAESHPAVAVRKYVKALIADGKLEEANALMEDYYMSIGKTPNPAQPQGKKVPDEDAVEPQFATGLPNTVVAPETLGKVQGQ